jgi:hypothetical protein
MFNDQPLPGGKWRSGYPQSPHAARLLHPPPAKVVAYSRYFFHLPHHLKSGRWASEEVDVGPAGFIIESQAWLTAGVLLIAFQRQPGHYCWGALRQQCALSAATRSPCRKREALAAQSYLDQAPLCRLGSWATKLNNLSAN